jgi:hypothetical protein
MLLLRSLSPPFYLIFLQWNMASLHRINTLVSSDIDLDGMSPMMLMGVGWAQAAAAWIDTGFQAATASSCIDDPARSLRGNLQMMNPCVQAAGGAAEEGDQVVRSLLLSVKLMVTTMPLAYQVSCHETRILLIRSHPPLLLGLYSAQISQSYTRVSKSLLLTKISSGCWSSMISTPTTMHT